MCQGSTDPPLELVPTASPLLPPLATALSPKLSPLQSYTDSGAAPMRADLNPKKWTTYMTIWP